VSGEGDLRGFAAERAPRLIAEAEELALAKARERLGEQMYRALLEAAGDALAGEARAAERGREEEPAEAGTGFYVYGIVGSETQLPEGLEGVDPADPPWLLAEDGLAAIVSRVSLAEFGEESLRENLEDVEWLEAKARAHEEVLEAALAATTVVPLRLCTIYSGEEQVQEMLERERPLLEDALARLVGKAEWGAKAIAAPGALERAALERVDAVQGDEPTSGGVEYLNRKRNQARAREVADEIADEWAREIHEPLAALAAEALLNPLQRSEVSGHEGDMLLNGVYLVEADRLERFRAAAAELAERHRADGIAVELTGPWPAYNFVQGSIEAAR
jgi:hypothetical protein